MTDVILVDENDNQIGTEEKIKAHKEGKLHRCVSILVFNHKGELLLQQRADNKYHSGGLWSNTCCGHQAPGETSIMAGEKRLQEEFGFACKLEEAFTFTYKAIFSNGLTENEFDHLLIGKCEPTPNPNSEEIKDWKWMSIEAIEKDITINPKQYTEWFKIIIKELHQRRQ